MRDARAKDLGGVPDPCNANHSVPTNNPGREHRPERLLLQPDPPEIRLSGLFLYLFQQRNLIDLPRLLVRPTQLGDPFLLFLATTLVLQV